MTTDLGRRNQEFARRQAAGQLAGSPRRRADRSSLTDRWGRELGKVNPEGKPYSPCPMCRRRSMVEGRLKTGEKAWKCESCGYADTADRPLV